MALFLFAFSLQPSAYCLAAEGGAAPDAETKKILDGLQRMYENAKDFSASFSQTYRSVHGNMKSESTGKIMFAKPMKVRWEYASPRKRIFIANGNNLWIYTPEDNQAMVSKKFEQTQLTLALSFLQGGGKIAEEFTVKLAKTYDTGWTLKLTPRRENAQITYMFLDVSNASFLVTAVEIEDVLGNRNRFAFEKPSVNAGLKDDLFTFKPPADAEVIPVPEGFLK